MHRLVVCPVLQQQSAAVCSYFSEAALNWSPLQRCIVTNMLPFLVTYCLQASVLHSH
jgi:hypothetical protein